MGREETLQRLVHSRAGPRTQRVEKTTPRTPLSGVWRRAMAGGDHRRFCPRPQRRGLRIAVGVATTVMRRWPRDGQALARPVALSLSLT
jgi:hypothetical protein